MKTVNKQRILKIVECAMLVAVAVVIDLIPFPKWPQGGSVSLCMIPVAFCSFRHGTLWGLICGFILSCVQMITGFYLPPAGDFLSVILCIMLDYVLAFTLLGSADFFRKLCGGKKILGYIVGTSAAGIIRLICSFLSGILLWGSYAPEGTPVWIYSLGYNASYMIPNTIIAAIILVALCSLIDPVTLKHTRRTH